LTLLEGVVYQVAYISSRESGAKDDAVRQLLTIRWNDAEILAGVEVLNISEKGFMGLASDEQTQLLAVAIEFASMAKGLARHAISLGEEAHAAGDEQRAQEHYQAVRHFGDVLNTGDHMLVVQMLGKAVVAMADEKLAAAD
jgi:hypothetical protein